MSESLRNDGRVWVPAKAGETRLAVDIPENERDYFLERKYPSFGNLVPRDVASRNAKEMCDAGKGVGKSGLAVYLDFADSIKRLGEDAVRAKYGNLFDMYAQITGENPYKTPMRIYPAVHYTMGGLWVDYNLSTTIKGLYALGEANFSEHGANRLGASALMQGLADGYFVIPSTLSDYLAEVGPKPVDKSHPAFAQAVKDVQERTAKLLAINGTKTANEYHKELGKIIWEYCGMSRNAEGLKKAQKMIQELRADFWKNLKVSGEAEELNPNLERAGRVADFLELGELMIVDALDRNESCGGHFREEYQTEENEAQRNDDDFAYVAAWEYKGDNQPEQLHKEELVFENVKLTQRSYK
jgi:succinate dehydrogenase / fumarate reductase, flavoprotein subunit